MASALHDKVKWDSAMQLCKEVAFSLLTFVEHCTSGFVCGALCILMIACSGTLLGLGTVCITSYLFASGMFDL
eukprot:3398361-Amphidinium_carterae.1